MVQKCSLVLGNLGYSKIFYYMLVIRDCHSTVSFAFLREKESLFPFGIGVGNNYVYM